MDSQSTVTKDELKVALLENNERMYEKINAAIEKSAMRITQAVTTRTDPFITEIRDLAEAHGRLKSKVETIDSRIGNMWAKMIAIGAACATVGGFLGILIEAVFLRK
jgi:hypothetical protein